MATISNPVRRILLRIGNGSISLYSTVSVHVTISQGELRGTIEKSAFGTTYASFKGIPYATPPLGNLRFKAPLPLQKWKGIRDATKHGAVCPQWDMVTRQGIEGNEDCLFLNVFSPNIKGKLPVMLWIHGGGFQYGSGNTDVMGPDYFVEEGVILVTMNYRLGVLGFLCLDDEEAPGNAGMKDQVMALKWVKENIFKFGGDPDNVTLFGGSAGAASASYHLSSPMSKGLFHKVILQSGCFMNEWATIDNCRERGFRIGKHLELETDDVKELVSFLRIVPPAKFFRIGLTISNAKERYQGTPIFFCPVVEKQHEGQECFLPKDPIQCLNEGLVEDVPMMVGYNDAEGIMLCKETFKLAKEVEEDFRRRIPKNINRTISPEFATMLAEIVREFYFKNKSICKETEYETMNMETDIQFGYHIQRFAIQYAQNIKSPVYFYMFTCDSKLNVPKTMTPFSHLKGANHNDELYYQFMSTKDIEEGSEEWKATKQTVKLWCNFAKFGNPTPDGDPMINVKWKPLTPNRFNYMDIGLQLVPRVDPHKDRFDFWNKIYQQVDSFMKKL